MHNEGPVVYCGRCPISLIAQPTLLRISRPQVSVDEAKVGPEAARQIHALIREKESRTPAQLKIDSQLLIESKLRRGDPIGREIPSLRLNVETDEQNKLELVVTAHIDQKLLTELSRMGIVVKASFPQYNSLTVRMSLDQMETVAALEQVRFIQPQPGYSLAQKRLKQLPPHEFDPTVEPNVDRAFQIASDIQNVLAAHRRKKGRMSRFISVSRRRRVMLRIELSVQEALSM